MTELDVNIATAFGSPPPPDPEPGPISEGAEIVVTAPRYVPAALRISIVMGTAIALAGGVAACVADTTADPKVPTLSAGQLARTIEQYPGRTVRVCGEFKDLGDPEIPQTKDVWVLSPPTDPHPHGVGVNVVSCAMRPPTLDQQGCVVGMIAYRDGTLNRPTGPVVISDDIRSFLWYMHPSCQATPVPT